MKVSYFPGCTLKNKAKDLDVYARLCAEKLDIQLEEIENWQCCGGVFSMGDDEIATKLSSIRALDSAKEKNQILVSVCSACHNVLKQTNYAFNNNPDFSLKVNNYLAPDINYTGETKVLHYLELLRDVVGYEKIKQNVVNSLKDKKIAAYYGCLLLRPSKVLAMDDPENPTIMEDLIKALGATPVIYPYRNECCGGYITLEDAALANKKSGLVKDSALSGNADVIVTACPLCKYNLEKNKDVHIPVVYITELLAEAFGLKEEHHG